MVHFEPVEHFDRWAQARLASGADGLNRWPRWGGRTLGKGASTFAFAAGPLVYGLAFRDPEARRLGVQSLESLYLSATLARVLKTLTGRARPGRALDPDLFRPLNDDPGFHAFPSDHATRVFAVAATFAETLKERAPWVPYVAYGAASWTATTRVVDEAHWLTDVLGGALLGILSARWVERLNSPAREPRLVPRIESIPGGDIELGLALRVH